MRQERRPGNSKKHPAHSLPTRSGHDSSCNKGFSLRIPPRSVPAVPQWTTTAQARRPGGGVFGPTCVGEYPSHGYLARPGARKIEPLGQNADFKMGRDIVFAMARGRMTIGLYSSYDRSRFAEPHRRAIARAAPIALAFDGNLATFGFPFEEGLITPQEVAGWVSSTTSIGEAGLYLRELAQRGRFQTFGFPKRGFPPQLGEPIVTTNRPDPKKATTATALAGLLQRGTSILLVFGLGRRGLDDRDVYPLGRYHFDLTGRGLSLETATAIGAAPALIAAHLVE